MKKNTFLLAAILSLLINNTILQGMDNNLNIDWENTQDTLNDLGINWEDTPNIIDKKLENIPQSTNQITNTTKRKKNQNENNQNKKLKSNENKLTYSCNENKCKKKITSKYKDSLRPFAIKVMMHKITHEEDYKKIKNAIENCTLQEKSNIDLPCLFCDTVISSQDKKYLKPQHVSHVARIHREEQLKVIQKEIEKENQNTIEKYKKNKTSETNKEKLVFTCNDNACKQEFYSMINHAHSLKSTMHGFVIRIVAHTMNSHMNDKTISEEYIKENSSPLHIQCPRCTKRISVSKKKLLKHQLLRHIAAEHEKEKYKNTKNEIITQNQDLINKYENIL